VVAELKKEERELMEAKDFETMGIVREAEIVLKKAEGDFSRKEAEEEEHKLMAEIPMLEAENNTAAIKIIEDVVESLVVAEHVKTGVAAMVAGNYTPLGVTLAPPVPQQPVWNNPPTWYMQPPWWVQYPYNQTGMGPGPVQAQISRPPSWYMDPPAWYQQQPPAWYYQSAPGQQAPAASPTAPPEPAALPAGHPGQGWLPYPYGLPPGLPADVVAMTAPPKDTQDKWLSEDQGRMWLDTANGLVWLSSSPGQQWLFTAGGEQWLWSPWGGRWLTTPAGMTWASQNPQMAAQFMPPSGWTRGPEINFEPSQDRAYGGGVAHEGPHGTGGGAWGAHQPQPTQQGAGSWGNGNGWGKEGQDVEGWRTANGNAIGNINSNSWGNTGRDYARGNEHWGNGPEGQARWGQNEPWHNEARGGMPPGAAPVMHPVVKASQREVTESLDKMLHQAKDAQEVYDRVEETMENLRSAVSMIKEFTSQVFFSFRPKDKNTPSFSQARARTHTNTC